MSSFKNLPLSWALSRQWHQAPLPWLAWALGGVAALAAVAAAGAWVHLQQRELAAARRDLATLQARPAPAAASAAAEPEPDFARRLPVDASTADWVRDMQRVTGQLGVAVVSLVDTPRAATAEQLGRHDLQLTLRGPYPQIKLVLKELLDRHASTTVARLNLRVLTSPVDVEATLLLTRWSRPLLTAPASAPAPRASEASR